MHCLINEMLKEKYSLPQDVLFVQIWLTAVLLFLADLWCDIRTYKENVYTVR